MQKADIFAHAYVRSCGVRKGKAQQPPEYKLRAAVYEESPALIRQAVAQGAEIEGAAGSGR